MCARRAIVAVMLAWCVVPAPAENNTDGTLDVFKKDEGNSVHFYAQNLTPGTITATFETSLQNMTANVTFPKTVAVAGKQTVEIFALTPAQNGQVWHYHYKYACNIGSTAAVHDDACIYALPYEAGTTHVVIQGHHGKFSHTGENEYAIDWKMPQGTPVCAARDGLVVKSRGDSTQGGPDHKFDKLANCVFIQHSDGTIGEYLHLQHDGNKVKIGDMVKAGDVIGLSGSTGFSSGPHLHFAVFRLKSASERETIPVKFRAAEGEAVIPIKGHAYMAVLKASRPVAVSEPRKAPGG